MSSEMDLSTITIAALYWESVASFDRLLNHFKGSQNFPDTLPDDFGRLKVWAENVAAHRRGVMSLDHHLREASEVAERVKDLLKNLNDILEKTLSISLDVIDEKDNVQNSVEPHSTGPQTVYSDDSKIDDEIRATSPLKEAAKEIGNIITCLYRLSITVQSPASTDPLERVEKIDVSHFERLDVDYVSKKFPLGEDYLIKRLGKANTKRRQLLKCHTEHHEKIVGQRVAASDALDTGSSEGQEDSYSEASTDMRTIVSMVHPAYNNMFEVVPVDLDSRSEAGFSATSYASPSANPGSLRVPAPPPGFDQRPFQCPYCFIIVQTENRASWKKHVFQDLRPYVCTFKDCPQGAYLYESRHEWFAHEREVHRSEWFCSKCKKTFPSSDQFRKHLVKKHNIGISSSKERLDVIVARGARAIEGKGKCPLCPEKHASKPLESHLGRHLEQISLFILPHDSEENEDSDSERDSDDDGIATASDTKLKTSSFAQRVKQRYATAQTYLKAGTGINDFDKNGWTPIHKAAQSGDVKWATLLLESDCDLLATTRDEDKMQPLHIAAKAGHAEVATLLLKQSTVDINAKDGRFGKTAFEWARQKGHEDVIKRLIARNDIEVNAKDRRRGESALKRACKNGHEGVIKRQIARNDIEVNAKDRRWGEPELMRACENGDEGALKLLLARDDVEVNAQDGRREESALMRACGNGHKNIVKLLLSRDDVEVDAKDKDGKTALVWACQNSHKDIVRLLLSRDDVEVNAQDKHGKTALVWACQNGHDNIAKLLLARRNVEINVKDNRGWTAFLWACQNSHKDVVKLLISRKDVDANAKDNRGWTAFLWACQNAHEDIVKLLLARGDVEINAKDNRGWTAFLWACQNSHENIVRLLVSRDDIEVNVKDRRRGESALMRACENGHEGIIKLLLSRNDIKVDAKDNDGKTALVWACQNGHRGVVKLLIARDDIEVDAKDNNGKTAFIWACQNGYEDVIKLLLARDDIDVNAKDNDEKSGLIYAHDKGYQSIENQILQFVNNRKVV